MRYASIAVLVLGSFSRAVAGSLTLNDAASGLRIDSHLDGATVCVLKPVELTRPADCEGVDLDAVAGRVPPQAALMALVTQGDWTFSVALMNQPRPSGPLSKTKARDFLRGARRSATGFKFESEEPDFDVINRLRVFSYTAVSNDPGLPFNAMVQYVVVGERSISAFSFASDVEHLGALKRHARDFMNAVTKPGAASTPSWSDGGEDSSAGDPYYEAGKAFGALLANVLLLAGICAGAVLIYRSFRRRGRGTSREL